MAFGAPLLLLFPLFCFRRDDDGAEVVEEEEEEEEDMDEASSGAKADARREEMSFVDHMVVMLSGKRDGSSTTKTSDSLRRPRRTALFSSSFLRMWPRPSASPVVDDICQ